MCRHCPIPPVYGGRFFAVPADVVLDDVRRQVAAGARHIDFGDPDFLNGPDATRCASRARCTPSTPSVTFSFTAKVEHIVAHARRRARAGRGSARCSSSARSNRCPTACWRRWPRATTPPTWRRALAVVRGAGMSLRPTFVAVHAVDDAGRLPGAVRLHPRPRPAGRGRSRCSCRSACWSRPGSLLLAAPDIAPYLGALDPEALTYRWTHPDPRMDRSRPTSRRWSKPPPGERPGRGHVRPHPPPGRRRRRRRHARRQAAPAPVGRRPPHLTEPWFCCAQPTRRQLGAF